MAVSQVVSGTFSNSLCATETWTLEGLVESTVNAVHKPSTNVTTATTLNASSTPDAEKAYSKTVTLSGGTASIDMTSLTNALDDSLDLTGKTVRYWYFGAYGTNTAFVEINSSASSGAHVLGSATGRFELYPGGSLCMYVCDASSRAVGASNKTVQFASVHATAQVEVIALAG